MRSHKLPATGADGRGGRTRLLLDALRTSFWFVPSLLGGSALILAWFANRTDVWLAEWPLGRLPPGVYVGTTEHALQVTSTLLSSMMTMTSLVFSITMVVLTLAASQFGPRLIRNFMASAATQLVLGTFVMTTVYCLLVLGTITSRSDPGQQAFASVSGAIALVFVSLAFLVGFLHFLARSIVSESVIKRVGREMAGLWEGLKPIAEERNLDPAAALPDDYETIAAKFGPTSAGYVQAIDFGRLVALAKSADVLVALKFAPGDYVIEGGSGIGVYPGERCSAQLQHGIRGAISVGPNRTPVQDPEFSIRHLVEIAVRALSPSLNDPYTAVAAINQLSSSLGQLMGRALPASQLRDEQGTLRLICPRPTYASILGSAFNQIRQNAKSAPLVYIYLVEALHRIAERATLQPQKEALKDQLDAVVRAAQREIADAHDRQAIETRASAALALLEPSTDEVT